MYVRTYVSMWMLILLLYTLIVCMCSLEAEGVSMMQHPVVMVFLLYIVLSKDCS